MTQNKENKPQTKACQPLKRLACLVLSCSVLALSGCGKVSVPTVFSKEESINKKTLEMRKELTNAEKKVASATEYNPKNLFGEQLKSDKARLDRLERAMQDMRNEFESVKPSIKRLTSLEGEIQRLIRELQALNAEDTMPMQQQSMTPELAPQAYTPPPAPAPKKAYTPPPTPKKASYQKKSPPPATGGMASAYDLRVGEHAGRTRLVIDVNAKTPFTIDVDNTENIAVIELPEAKWTTAMTKSFAKSNFVSSYSVESAGDGSILILQLKRDAKVSYKNDLAGSSGSSRRLVIDLIGA